MLNAPRILIIDDTSDNIKLLAATLHDKDTPLHIKGLTDSTQALDCICEFAPDLIILDLMMGQVDGFQILEKLQPHQKNLPLLPILVITADQDELVRARTLALGATDFLTRPHRLFDVKLRVNNLLQMRELHVRAHAHNRHLQCLVSERTQELAEANDRLHQSQLETRLAKREMLERLALVGEHHDDDTGVHTRRVAKTSALLCERMGRPSDEAYTIQLAAPLHDVGKIGIPDSILRKPAKLTPDEFAIVKTHCEIGRQILDGGRSDLLMMACQIAYTHHERWDGQGYPNNLQGQDIPLEGRIVAVADVFDALTHSRPYKQAWPVADAVEEIRRQSGCQFDPQVVDAFLTLDHEELI